MRTRLPSLILLPPDADHDVGVVSDQREDFLQRRARVHHGPPVTQSGPWRDTAAHLVACVRCVNLDRRAPRNIEEFEVRIPRQQRTVGRVGPMPQLVNAVWYTGYTDFVIEPRALDRDPS